MKKYDLVIIGGGSAGMAAAIEARKNGISSILILERENYLGGILNQCIHNGFGLTEFKEELTGPEYLNRFVKQIKELNIEYKLNAFVNSVSKNKVITYTSSEDGVVEIEAKSIIFAIGCYERAAGAISLPGDRPSGILTAGTAQRYLNVHGYLAGKKIVILGSGDIGLIMARRLTLEGAKVECVAEIMPYSNGLARNIQQCLIDYDIPLYLSHTVSKVVGKSRVEKVILSQVDEKMNFIPGSEKEIECDALILSVGLIPYTKELLSIGAESSFGKINVDQNLQTSIPGIFTCGNCLHVHDVVDFVTEEGREAGHSAALYLNNNLHNDEFVNVLAKNGISYAIPQKISTNLNDNVNIKFRVRTPVKDKYVVVKHDDNIITKTYYPALVPSEMVMLKIDKNKLANLTDDIEILLEDK